MLLLSHYVGLQDLPCNECGVVQELPSHRSWRSRVTANCPLKLATLFATAILAAGMVGIELAASDGSSAAALPPLHNQHLAHRVPSAAVVVVGVVSAALCVGWSGRCCLSSVWFLDGFSFSLPPCTQVSLPRYSALRSGQQLLHS